MNAGIDQRIAQRGVYHCAFGQSVKISGRVRHKHVALKQAGAVPGIFYVGHQIAATVYQRQKI